VKPDQKLGPTAIRPPAIELPHTIAASVTGGYVYRGKKFPELDGAYVFADWETRRVWAARFENDRLKEMPELVKPNVRISAFGEDNAGELYFAEYDTGLIYTFARNDAGAANAKFPTKLSETGLFADVKKHELAAGVTEFRPTEAQWADGARALHALALPGDSAVSLFAEAKPMPSQVFWHNFRMHFPNDAVLLKTVLYLEPKGGVPRRYVETQLLHFTDGDWRGYSYVWREDQSDADLAPADGAEVTIPFVDRDDPKRTREHVHTVPSRTQCLTCHNAWSEFALAFTVPQLNSAGSEGGNQLHRLTSEGFVRRFDKAGKPQPHYADEGIVAGEPTFVHDERGKLEPRARRYLHVHCHRFGGGGGQVVLELDYAKPLKETGVLNVKPKQGDFGLEDARLIAPGAPERSVLYYRMAKFGRGRMPHLGSEMPDFHGLGLIGSWIADLGGKGPLGGPNFANDISGKLRDVAGALPFARQFHGADTSAADRAKVLAEAAKLPSGPVRDLFEGYLPPDPKGRKLGSNPRPASILALKGDDKNGEALFFNKELKCANCHTLSDKGTSLGPDLTKIGANRTRAELLDALLNPSARVEPQYAAYAVRTKDERTYTGIVQARNEKELVLIDAEGKKVVVPGANVESVRPSRLSLMPDGQMSGLTPQEAADLLEFLVQRK
jgi:putative heme-binding domain-containing protein